MSAMWVKSTASSDGTNSSITPQARSPKNWKIVKTHSAGELSFYNGATGENSWYTPEGMTAEEILEIPGSNEYFKTKEQAQQYINQMAAEKARDETRSKV